MTFLYCLSNHYVSFPFSSIVAKLQERSESVKMQTIQSMNYPFEESKERDFAAQTDDKTSLLPSAVVHFSLLVASHCQ